jgi:hypothetical protein
VAAREGVFVVALLFALADLMGFAHQAVERHRVCADHGELVHGETDAPDGDHGSGAADPDPTPDHDADDHCRLGAFSAAPALLALVAPALAPPPVPATPSTPALASRTTSDGRALLRAAPKTSPPRA